MKRKKISVFKLVRMVFITFLIMISLMFVFKTSANCSTSNNYKEIIVHRGDNLWRIAKRNGHNANIQMIIYEIKKMNNMETSDIFPGQNLKIPLNY